jgi:hypothetical protein
MDDKLCLSKCVNGNFELKIRLEILNPVLF